MSGSPYPGVVDYSDDPILPPWYIPGWTNQNQDNVVAPVSPFILTELPSSLTTIQVTGTWTDGIGNPWGGYLTFETSADLLVTVVATGAVISIPAGLVGNIPSNIVGDVTAFNQQGSGKISLIYGTLNVLLLATDNAQITPLETPVDQFSITGDQPIPVTNWVYHVREYWMGGRAYDITVPSATSPVDINSLIVPGTTYLNVEWDRGY